MADHDDAPLSRLVRGRLRVYLGSAAGVGKTYAMLSEGHRRAERGADVVVGFAEPHARPQTIVLLDGLEVVPRTTLDGVPPGRGRAGLPARIGPSGEAHQG